MEISLERASKEYADLIAKKREIEDRRVALAEERTALLRELKTLPAAWSGSPPPEVLELVESGSGTGAARARIVLQRVKEIGDSLPSFSAALEILTPRILAAKMGASVAICEAVRPEYQKRVRAVCEALVTLDNRYSELLGLMDQLNLEDVAWSVLRPMHARFLDRPGSQGNSIEAYIREAVEYELVPRSMLSGLTRQ